LRAHRVLIAVLVAASLAAAACNGSSATPLPTTGAPSTTAPGTGTPAPQGTSAQSVAVNGFYLRSWSAGASNPDSLYFAVPQVISDGRLSYLPEAPWTDDAPTPIYVAPVTRSISQAGLAAIVARAEADGLLGAASTFDCPPDTSGEPLIGGVVPHFELRVNGVTHIISGSCAFAQPTEAAGSPAPGTWAAFDDFAAYVDNLSGSLDAELGPETPFEPTALIVWAAPAEEAWWGPFQPDPGAASKAWPLSTPLASFGNEVHWSGVAAPDPSRCTLLTGADVPKLLAGVKGVNDGVRFTDGTTSKVLAIRVVMPGEPTDGLCGD
jgi:hypothetical protein